MPQSKNRLLTVNALQGS